jgi:hypothetical protein
MRLRWSKLSMQVAHLVRVKYLEYRTRKMKLFRIVVRKVQPILQANSPVLAIQIKTLNRLRPTHFCKDIKIAVSHNGD